MIDRRRIAILAGLSILLATGLPGFGQGRMMMRGFALDKGSLILTGGFSFSSASDLQSEASGKDGRVTSFQVNPSVRYFVIPGLAVGGHISMGSSSRGDETARNFSLGPEVTYYLGAKTPRAERQNHVFPFFSASLSYTRFSGRAVFENLAADYKTNGTMLGLGTGIMYMVSRGYGLFLRAQYDFIHRNRTAGINGSGNRFTISGGITAFVF